MFVASVGAGFLSNTFFFFSSRRRHTRCSRDWSSDVCSSDLARRCARGDRPAVPAGPAAGRRGRRPASRRAAGPGAGIRAMNDVVLQARGLVKEFGGLRAVNSLDFTLRRGELRCLTGPNGARKSTLFKLLTGQLKPTAGTIHFKGVDVTRLLPHEIARAGIGIKFQVPRVYDSLS